MVLAVTTALFVGTALVVVLALSVVPVHVTLGAGSLRCGTVLNHDTTSEIRDLCPAARSKHLRAAIGAGVALAEISLAPFLPQVSGEGRASRLWLTSSVAVWALAAVFALGWIASGVEYSPPHHEFEL
jgi:hypothetical protein